jgi:glycosyltransferase involved in cell wall biosynthesis
LSLKSGGSVRLDMKGIWMSKIDLIIPAYNAHDTLDRAVGSIIMQTIRDDIKVTIADDASPDGTYDDIVHRYSDVLSIQTLRLPVNGGPGVARQYALDRTDCDYIMFMDADDTLSSAFSAETLLLALRQEPNTIAVFGSFLEETDSGFELHEKDSVWLHGKMYLRSYWIEHSIRFHPTSKANEDNGVNSIIKLTASGVGKKIVTIPDVSYYWHYTPSSITRNNDHAYYFASSYKGYVENMIYAINRSKEILGSYTDAIVKHAAQVLCFLYCYWNETIQYQNDLADINKQACKDFYHNVYRHVASLISYDDFSQIYNSQVFASQRRFPCCMPTQTIFDFINDIKEG